jgi:CSLREA domain-containing protein
MRQWLAFALFAVPLCGAATTITVNSSDDTVANDGHCTMREAIAAANNNLASGAMPGECAAGQPGPVVDTIVFNIPGSGVHTITPATSYAQIGDIVFIDGYTQPGAHANTLSVGDDALLLIAFDAHNLTDPLFYFHGSKFGGGESGGSTVRGLAIHHFDHASAFGVGTGFGNGANNITLQGNLIGTGADDNSNAPPISCVSSTGLIVGGAAPAARNVITAAGSDGVELNQCSNGIVQGNYIGLSADGAAKFGNLFNGIEAIQGGNGNLIGGPNPGEGNVIAGTTQSAIKIDTSDGAIIQGNFLGTDASGTGPIGNPFGVILSSTNNTLIGGPAEGEGNVISGNSFGMRSDQAVATTVQGNAFGVDVTGSPLPNVASAILIASGSVASQGLIGGTAPGEGNVIANNCGAGVNIQNGVTQWAILGNSIAENAGFGIALQNGTPTNNDPGDGDIGSNDLQNYPVLTSASVNGGVANISGTFNSAPSKQYRLEFFSSIECNKSGFGEGRTLLGFKNVTTDGSGNANFGPLTFSGAPNDQTAFSATATDPDGNTSEFSPCVGGIGRLFANGFQFQCQ